jgi:hypothetical protein
MSNLRPWAALSDQWMFSDNRTIRMHCGYSRPRSTVFIGALADDMLLQLLQLLDSAGLLQEPELQSHASLIDEITAR